MLKKERKGKYLGKTVQVIPHITDRIKEFIKHDVKNEDFIICEIGGTVGDIESLPFIEAIRQFSNDVGKKNTLFIHLTLVPFMKASDEIKTKPTQHSVKELRSIGIQPDIIICRSERAIPLDQRKKISLMQKKLLLQYLKKFILKLKNKTKTYLSNYSKDNSYNNE